MTGPSSSVLHTLRLGCTAGSGKTFTMGSEYKPGGRAHGVIPEAIGAIFGRIASIRDYECCVRVSFVEIHTVCKGCVSS